MKGVPGMKGEAGVPGAQGFNGSDGPPGQFFETAAQTRLLCYIHALSVFIK